MKKVLTVSLFLLLGTVPAFAGVQKGQFEFSPTVGISQPVGDLDDGGNTGFVVGGRFGYNFTEKVSVGVAINYNSFGIDDDLTALLPGIDIDLTSLEYVVDVRALLGNQPNSSPYVKGMLGAAKLELKFSAGAASLAFSESKLAFGGGVGYLFKGEGNIGGFVEADIINISTSGSSSSYISLRGGVSFFFGASSGP
ncbi:MAG: porin family protein [candidate division Zixibacteria bacterium]|nr:porin family protein [candidate division Zixibacteria bacterium]